MTFFKNKDDAPEKWKEKYFNLLDNQEKIEKDYKVNENLLCKTIIRFALAVKGLNKELDPHLNRIRDLLKSGVQSEKLQKELEIFSNALMLLEEKPVSRHADASLLFEFLSKQYPYHRSEFEILQERYDRREFINYQALFAALLELINVKESQSDLSIELHGPDDKVIRAHLIRLLEGADIPESYFAEAERIKTCLQSDADPQSLGGILNDVVVLLLEIRKHLAVQQVEMADFLSNLTDQLAELALKASGVNIATEISMKKRNLLDESVSQQMQDLQNKSASATQLEPLKQLIHNKLSGISRQLHDHNIQERLEREELHQELRLMTQKVREMEVESSELRLKLDIAQSKATRDPLTNLPNRLAFDERLGVEVARCKRYAMPLTMAVWDIDFFKKINDNYGHKSGDKALIIISQLLARHCRETDFVARFGGEEFVMLLPETDAQTGLSVADKLRETVEKANFKAGGDTISITLSCGISQFLDGDSNESFFERADKALYIAKQKGRNTCVVG